MSARHWRNSSRGRQTSGADGCGAQIFQFGPNRRLFAALGNISLQSRRVDVSDRIATKNAKGLRHLFRPRVARRQVAGMDLDDVYDPDV